MAVQENMEAGHRWQKHIAAIRGDLNQEELMIMGTYFGDHKQIGFDQGQVRPDPELGKWDLFELLEMWGVAEDRSLIMCGLSLVDVRQEEHREELRYAGVDPDNAREVAHYERLKTMSPTQLDSEIERLEAMLQGGR